MTEVARVYQEQCHSEAGLPCPFCGSDQLLDGSWYIDDGEVDAWECSKCFAGAPKSAWNTRHATAAWHYPAHNLDVPNLPEPGQKVVAYYRSGDRICGPVVMGDLNRDDGPPTIAGKSIYQPVVRWCAIPQE